MVDIAHRPLNNQHRGTARDREQLRLPPRCAGRLQNLVRLQQSDSTRLLEELVEVGLSLGNLVGVVDLGVETDAC